MTTEQGPKALQDEVEILRFTTAGSVDDGKSTLIGRLLYDSKSIFEDQVLAIEESSKKRGLEHIDLSLLTDGLKAEREQGITIDVAYRYFSTPKRRFIIADTPGHIQYTRNMVTGASTANLAIILIDARKGVLEQTFRHSYISSLMKIPHLVVCINKMDLVGYDEKVFERIVKDYQNFSAKLDISDITFIPVSALKGDNIVERSENMPWYQGSSLLYQLEHVNIGSDWNHIDARFPVQYVIRPQSEAFHDFRGYAGRVSSGILRKGDKVMVLPSGFTSVIERIEFDGKELEHAFPPMSVTICLKDQIDISRGDLIVKVGNVPEKSQDIDAMLCWLDNTKMKPGNKYILRHNTSSTQCIIKEIRYKVDINTLSRVENSTELDMNEIAKVHIRTASPLFFDHYRMNRATGSLILVDEGTNETVGAGMIS